jgi:hypothetical protein
MDQAPLTSSAHFPPHQLPHLTCIDGRLDWKNDHAEPDCQAGGVTVIATFEAPDEFGHIGP